MDHLPFCVQLHAMDEEFTVVYRNQRDEERLRQLDPERAAAHDRRLRSLAELVAKTGKPDHVEIRTRARNGTPLDWDWIIIPLLDERGDVEGLISVIENITFPVVARRAMASALGQATGLIVEVAQMTEQDADDDTDTEALLAAVARRLASLVAADDVTFYEYRSEPRILAARTPTAASQPEAPDAPATLPCDPDKSAIPAQVAFDGRIYRGTVDFANVEFWDYVDLLGMAPADGTRVILVPWRAGTERMGVVLARRRRLPDGLVPDRDFTQEEGAVLMAAGHAAGLICQRKRAERRLADRAKELESLEQAKSHFLRLASHELRGPVGVLNGYVSMLFDGDLPAKQTRDIQRILLQAVDRMNLLLTQLIDVTRLQEGLLHLNERRVDLRQLVRNAIDHVVPLQERDRRPDLDVVLPDDPVPVIVDAPRIEMVVQNLLDNAFKYSERGDAVACHLHVDGGAMRVVVSDEGIGISEEERAQLFQRFGRAVNERNSHIRGTGLGLYISREIARMHGGDVSVSSEENRGSCFQLLLPMTLAARDEEKRT